jgi:CDGSH-type Zn-finger protein
MAWRMCERAMVGCGEELLEKRVLERVQHEERDEESEECVRLDESCECDDATSETTVASEHVHTSGTDATLCRCGRGSGDGNRHERGEEGDASREIETELAREERATEAEEEEQRDNHAVETLGAWEHREGDDLTSELRLLCQETGACLPNDGDSDG